MTILTDPMREFLKSENKEKWRKSAYYGRIVEYAVEGLKDLALIAQMAPESRSNKIFNKENLQPLFEAIFHVDPATDWTPEKRRTILEMLYNLIMVVNKLELASKITSPEAVKLGNKTLSGSLRWLRIIYTVAEG